MAAGDLKDKTRRGLYWTFLNQFANNGLTFVVGIIMARLLSPSDFGITALPAVFISIAQVFIVSGFIPALIRKNEVTEADLSTCFYYSIAVAFLCYFLIFMGSPLIARFYDEPILVPLIRVTAITFLVSPLASPQNVILQRKLDFKTIAKVAVATKIVGAVCGIASAYMGYGLWALIIMSVVSSFMQTLFMWFAVRWLPRSKWSKESFRYLWGFGNKLLASSLLDTLYNNITPIVVGKYFSTTQLGIYNRAKGYADLPSQQGTHVLQQVTYPVLSKMQDDKELLARSYRRMLKVSAFVVFPIMLMLSALARPVILLLVTAKWEDSIPLLQILCFASMWYPIHAINLNLLKVLGRSDLFLRLEIIKKIVGVTILVVSLPFGLIPFCYGMLISSIIALFINTYYTGKFINVGFLVQMKDLLPTSIKSMIVFIAITILIKYIDGLIGQLIIGGLIGGALYFSMAIIFHAPELNDVKYMLNRNS